MTQTLPSIDPTTKPCDASGDADLPNRAASFVRAGKALTTLVCHFSVLVIHCALSSLVPSSGTGSEAHRDLVRTLTEVDGGDVSVGGTDDEIRSRIAHRIRPLLQLDLGHLSRAPRIPVLHDVRLRFLAGEAIRTHPQRAIPRSGSKRIGAANLHFSNRLYRSIMLSDLNRLLRSAVVNDGTLVCSSAVHDHQAAKTIRQRAGRTSKLLSRPSSMSSRALDSLERPASRLCRGRRALYHLPHCPVRFALNHIFSVRHRAPAPGRDEPCRPMSSLPGSRPWEKRRVLFRVKRDRCSCQDERAHQRRSRQVAH